MTATTRTTPSPAVDSEYLLAMLTVANAASPRKTTDRQAPELRFLLSDLAEKLFCHAPGEAERIAVEVLREAGGEAYEAQLVPAGVPDFGLRLTLLLTAPTLDGRVAGVFYCAGEEERAAAVLEPAFSRGANLFRALPAKRSLPPVGPARGVKRPA